jgi:hypothetical protein
VQWTQELSKFQRENDVTSPYQTENETLGTLKFELPLRYVFHWLLDALFDDLPEEGMFELLETMKEIHEFYSGRIREETSSLPKPEKFQAAVTKTIVRPTFPLAEGEE